MNYTTRHSRFGGTFAVMNKNVPGKNIITKKLVKTVEEVSRDRVKARHKIRARKSKGSELYKNRVSSRQVRKTLQEKVFNFTGWGYKDSLHVYKDNFLRITQIFFEGQLIFSVEIFKLEVRIYGLVCFSLFYL